jgi:futalosine hydrolase
MPDKPLIGLITAVPFEAALLLKEMRGARQIAPSVTAGRLGGKKAAHVSSGIGIANAARAATALIERFSPCAVILFGIGGAYPQSGLRPGDLAVAEREVYADTGLLLEDGLHGMEAIGIPLVRKGGRRYFNEFPMDRKLLNKALKTNKDGASGVFLTVSQCTGTLRRALELERKHGALCENMEGAAVAQVCAFYGTPAVELRGISNVVEDRDTGRWAKELAAKKCQDAVLRLLESPD